MQRPLTVQSRKAIYEEALKVMRAHYRENGLSLEQVARAVHISKRHLQRVFQEAGGDGFRSTLRRIRMEAAKRRIAANPKLPTREVAEMVGYKQPSQFAKAFRSHVGVSLHEYRRRVAS